MFRYRALVLSFTVLGCHNSATWVADSSGRVVMFHNEQVKLPGLSYLSLGSPQPTVLQALRGHGFDCNEEVSTGQTQACVRPPGSEEPTGGVVMLEFQQAVLSGVQAHLQPPGDESGALAKKLYDDLEREWSHSYGRPVEVRRPGITAARHSLQNGTALLLVRYDGEPTLLAEHIQIQQDTVKIPPPPGGGSTR